MKKERKKENIRADYSINRSRKKERKKERKNKATPHKTAAVRPPITKTILVRRTRHVGHCWRSKNELISDILRWTSSHGREKAGRSARTYILQLYADTGCSLEDLPGAMDDRGRWREKVREISAGGAT